MIYMSIPFLLCYNIAFDRRRTIVRSLECDSYIAFERKAIGASSGFNQVAIEVNLTACDTRTIWCTNMRYNSYSYFCKYFYRSAVLSLTDHYISVAKIGTYNRYSLYIGRKKHIVG